MRRFIKAAGDASVWGDQWPCTLKVNLLVRLPAGGATGRRHFPAVFRCEGRRYGGVSNAKARGRFGALNNPADNGRDVPKAVVSAVVIDITHPDTADAMAPPPVDPVAATVEIRKG